MFTRNAFLLLLCAFATACHSSSSSTSGPSPAPAPSAPVADSQTPSEPVSAAPCPWSLKDSSTYKKYQDLGIEITVDCSMSSSFFNLGEGDLKFPLAVLDKQISLFDGWENHPRTIRIGGGAFHNSQDRLIQIPAREDNEDLMTEYLHNVRTLMEFEIKEFHSAVRFSYFDYHLGYTKDGHTVDVGAGTLGGLSEDLVAQDLVVLKKYKAQILAHSSVYPNIVIFHGNQFGYFRINDGDKSYNFSIGIDDATQKNFFQYLSKYEKVHAAYEPLALSVDAVAYPNVNFPVYMKMLEIAAQLRPSLPSADPHLRAIRFSRPMTSVGSYEDGFRISLMNDVLNIPVVDALGNMISVDEIKSCLQKADFSQSFSLVCPQKVN